MEAVWFDMTIRSQKLLLDVCIGLLMMIVSIINSTTAWDE